MTTPITISSQHLDPEYADNGELRKVTIHDPESALRLMDDEPLEELYRAAYREISKRGEG